MRVNRTGAGAAIACGLGALAILGATTAAPDLEELWPHLSGASWSYDRVELQWGAAPKSTATTVRFTLGDTTALSGSIRVQPLDVDVAAAAAETSAFWRQIETARPDLRARLTAHPNAGASSGLAIYDAGLLRVAADEIAAYRAAPTIRSWLYAEPDLTPGHTFRLQLVPGLADSVYVDGSVIGPADISTPAGSFAAAERIRYDVDWGWADVLDSLGAPAGRVRARTRGEMFYAPGVGPVLARETFVPQAEVQGSPPPAPVDSTFAELRLVSHSIGPASVSPRSWTAMKAAYR